MPLITICPRCKELETDEKGDRPAVGLCGACQIEVAAQLEDERAGHTVTPSRWDEHYAEYRQTLSELQPTQEELREQAKAEAEHYEELLRLWRH